MAVTAASGRESADGDSLDVEEVEVAEWIHFVREWREALTAAEAEGAEPGEDD